VCRRSPWLEDSEVSPHDWLHRRPTYTASPTGHHANGCPQPHILQLLQQGLKAGAEVRLAKTRAAFEQVLQLQAAQPNALHLLAKLAQSQGGLAKA
jgi:hypothetical protein